MRVSSLGCFSKKKTRTSLYLSSMTVRRAAKRLGRHTCSLFEVMNVVWQRVRRGALSPDHAAAVIDSFFGYRVRLLPQADNERQRLHRRAVEIAQEFGLPAAYDAHYVAVAESPDLNHGRLTIGWSGSSATEPLLCAAWQDMSPRRSSRSRAR
jgi:predicted nucleic acid-binding protein